MPAPAAHQLPYEGQLMQWPLPGLPFPALLAEDGRYIIESRSVYYAPSLTVLREVARYGLRYRASYWRWAIRPWATLPRLPHTARETAALGRLYGLAVFTGPAATEARWKAPAAEASIPHLATHGVLNAASPMYSYVALAHDGHHRRAATPIDKTAATAAIGPYQGFRCIFGIPRRSITSARHAAH